MFIQKNKINNLSIYTCHLYKSSIQTQRPRMGQADQSLSLKMEARGGRRLRTLKSEQSLQTRAQMFIFSGKTTGVQKTMQLTMVAHVICKEGKKISLKLDCCAYSFVESSVNKRFTFIFYYFLPTTVLFRREYRHNQSMPSQNMPHWPLNCSQITSFGKQKTQQKPDYLPFFFTKANKALM